MEITQRSGDTRMDEEDVVYIYTMEYDSVIKMNEILPFVTIWMDINGIMLGEISERKTNSI